MRKEGPNHFPQPAGHASFDAAQDVLGFLGCKGTWPAHVELFINQQVVLRAFFDPFSAQSVFILGIAPTQVQDLALGVVELHEVCIGPSLEPVKQGSCFLAERTHIFLSLPFITDVPKEAFLVALDVPGQI